MGRSPSEISIISPLATDEVNRSAYRGVGSAWSTDEVAWHSSSENPLGDRPINWIYVGIIDRIASPGRITSQPTKDYYLPLDDYTVVIPKTRGPVCLPTP